MEEWRCAGTASSYGLNYVSSEVYEGNDMTSRVYAIPFKLRSTGKLFVEECRSAVIFSFSA